MSASLWVSLLKFCPPGGGGGGGREGEKSGLHVRQIIKTFVSEKFTSILLN